MDVFFRYNFTASYLFTGILLFVLAVFVYFKNRKRIINKTFSAYTFSIAWWSLFSVFMINASTETWGTFWDRICLMGVVFIPTTFIHFTLAFLNIRQRYKNILKIAYLISIFFFIANFTPYFVKHTEPKYVANYFTVPGPLYYIFLAYFFLCVASGLFLLYKKLRDAPLGTVYREQIRWVFWATLLGYLGGALNYNLVLGIKPYGIVPFGNYLTGIYGLLIAYTIVKYHLMDIRIAITRAGIFFVVYACVLGLPFWFGFRTKLWVWALGLMGVLATAGPFIYGFLRRKAENVLLKSQIRYQKALRKFASSFIFIKNLEKLIQKVVAVITESIDLNFVAFYLKEDKHFYLADSKIKNSFELPKKIDLDSKFAKTFKGSSIPLIGDYFPKLGKIKIGLVCPLLLNHQLNGFILLGTKQKGKIFTDTDVDAFSVVSAQVSLALSEIYYFKAYQKATEQRHRLELEKTRLESAFQIAEAYRHELGNIINVISMSLMNLSSVGGYEPTKEDIEQTRAAIRNNVKRANYIFNAVSKYNENSDSSFQPQKLDKLINGTLEEYKEQINKQQIKLDLNLEKEIKVEANNNLPFALGYLIKGAITAIEYTKPDKKLIKIQLTNKNKQALLKISDTGGDVNQDKMYQGIGIERGKEGGILYFLARRIIFDHQGDFQVSSLDGKKGTIFTIKLPLYQK